jgi:ATPase subunit of ABC transporter with duplicated ATPase domains
MGSNGKGLMKRASVLALGALFVLPTAGFAQDWRRQQERREERQERREDRREERQERREERQERREARRGSSWGNYGGWGGSSQLRQTALNAGYNNGVQEGRRDRQRGERFNFTDESDYRNATEDYSSRLGSRALYQRYFRQGFENGYRDGWNGY